MKLRSFTLIEMLIVIMVAGVLMVMVMGFGGRFVRDIQARQLREEWISDVTAVRGKLLLSRYDHGQPIEQVVLSFGEGGMKQTTYYTDNTRDTNTITYTGMTLSPASITLIPYQLACGPNLEESIVTNDTNTIELRFDRSDKEYCYALTPTTCTFHRVACTE